MDAIPAILNEPIFQKAFDVASVNNMDKNDYILYQISKSKKYDMEIFGQESEERGMEKRDIHHIINIYKKGYTVTQISDLLTLPVQNVIEILRNHGFDIKD